MTRAWMLAFLALTTVTACAPVDGVLARYRQERQLWHAQFYERRINISFVQGSAQDIRFATAAFQKLLADDPLSNPAAASWDPEVRRDIRQLRVSSQIALANLYYLSARYADAGSLYQQTLNAGDMSLENTLETRLGAARSLYLAGDSDAVMQQCAAIFRELQDNPEFWSHDRDINDVFLNVPVALVRMYRDAGNDSAAAEFGRLGSEFYERIARERDGTRTAWQARLGAVQLHLIRREWNAATEGLQGILADSLQTAGDPGRLELLDAEIYAFALEDTARALHALNAIIDRYPDEIVAYAARYDIGALRAAHGDPASATEIFRSLESEDRTPATVASRAMLARARLLERSGNWDDAYTLLRRVVQLYPFTEAAIEAPIVVTQHYMDVGQKELARRALDRAREYYLSLLDRRSQFRGDRFVVQAALAESYVTAGRGADVAELLGSGSPQWDETSTAAAMLRSAEVYASVLGDTDHAAAMLKKCIERFPETRYAKVARRRLAALEGGSQ